MHSVFLFVFFQKSKKYKKIQKYIEKLTINFMLHKHQYTTCEANVIYSILKNKVPSHREDK